MKAKKQLLILILCIITILVFATAFISCENTSKGTPKYLGYRIAGKEITQNNVQNMSMTSNDIGSLGIAMADEDDKDKVEPDQTVVEEPQWENDTVVCTVSQTIEVEYIVDNPNKDTILSVTIEDSQTPGQKLIYTTTSQQYNISDITHIQNGDSYTTYIKINLEATKERGDRTVTITNIEYLRDVIKNEVSGVAMPEDSTLKVININAKNPKILPFDIYNIGNIVISDLSYEDIDTKEIIKVDDDKIFDTTIEVGSKISFKAVPDENSMIDSSYGVDYIIISYGDIENHCEYNSQTGYYTTILEDRSLTAGVNVVTKNKVFNVPDPNEDFSIAITHNQWGEIYEYNPNENIIEEFSLFDNSACLQVLFNPEKYSNGINGVTVKINDTVLTFDSAYIVINLAQYIQNTQIVNIEVYDIIEATKTISMSSNISSIFEGVATINTDDEGNDIEDIYPGISVYNLEVPYYYTINDIMAMLNVAQDKQIIGVYDTSEYGISNVQNINNNEDNQYYIYNTAIPVQKDDIAKNNVHYYFTVATDKSKFDFEYQQLENGYEQSLTISYHGSDLEELVLTNDIVDTESGMPISQIKYDFSQSSISSITIYDFNIFEYKSIADMRGAFKDCQNLDNIIIYSSIQEKAIYIDAESFAGTKYVNDSKDEFVTYAEMVVAYKPTNPNVLDTTSYPVDGNYGNPYYMAENLFADITVQEVITTSSLLTELCETGSLDSEVVQKITLNGYYNYDTTDYLFSKFKNITELSAEHISLQLLYEFYDDYKTQIDKLTVFAGQDCIESDKGYIYENYDFYNFINSYIFVGQNKQRDNFDFDQNIQGNVKIMGIDTSNLTSIDINSQININEINLSQIERINVNLDTVYENMNAIYANSDCFIYIKENVYDSYVQQYGIRDKIIVEDWMQGEFMIRGTHLINYYGTSSQITIPDVVETVEANCIDIEVSQLILPRPIKMAEAFSAYFDGMEVVVLGGSVLPEGFLDNATKLTFGDDVYISEIHPNAVNNTIYSIPQIKTANEFNIGQIIWQNIDLIDMTKTETIIEDNLSNTTEYNAKEIIFSSRLDSFPEFYNYANKYNLQKVVIPGALKQIKDEVSEVKEVSFWENSLLETIGAEGLFQNCFSSDIRYINFSMLSNLKTVYINNLNNYYIVLPESVQELKGSASTYSNNRILEFAGNVPNNLLTGIENIEIVIVPDEFYDNYEMFEIGAYKKSQIDENGNILDDVDRTVALTNLIMTPNIVVSEGIQTIKEKFIYSCNDVESVSLPSSLLNINDYAFSNCQRLSEITGGENIQNIGTSAFSNTAYMDKNEDLILGNILVKAYKTSDLEYIVPEGINNIYYSALQDTNVINLYLPSTLAEKGLQNVIINQLVKNLYVRSNVDLALAKPNSNINTYYQKGVTKIISNLGQYAKSIVVDDNAKTDITEIGENAFKNCINITEFIIPQSVSVIGKNAFENCNNLISISIPQNVTVIDEYTFSNCTSLLTITMPDTINEIKQGAFYGCESLGQFTIPQGIDIISDSIFSGCSSLTSVNIPIGVTKIGAWAFASCSALQEIVIPASVYDIDYNAFYNCKNTIIKFESTVTPQPWPSGNYNIELGYNNITTNEEYDYVVHNSKAYLTKYKGNSSSITIPLTIDGVNVVYFGQIFAGNSTIQYVTIDSNISEIVNYAFYQCSNLISVDIGENVVSIGDSAFYECAKLQNVTMGDNVTNIGDYAFYGCSALSSIEISNSLEKIGRYAFHGCQNLTTITIPASVYYIGYNAFVNSGLQEVTFEDITSEWERFDENYEEENEIIVLGALSSSELADTLKQATYYWEKI